MCVVVVVVVGGVVVVVGGGECCKNVATDRIVWLTAERASWMW